MQRVGTLIDNLQEQYRAGGDANALLLSAQMLVNELYTQVEAQDDRAGQHVVVKFPSVSAVPVQASQHQPEELIHSVANEDSSLMPLEEQTLAEVEIEPQPLIEEVIIPVQDEAHEPDTDSSIETEQPADPPHFAAAEHGQELAEKPDENYEPTSIKTGVAGFLNGQQWLLDIENEIPTLAHFSNEQQEKTGDESLNDRLKVEHKELGSVLKESPIRDLKKAIGINDRYQFINELFRGDEAMFERSLKTINSFNVYSEAEYWIKRELKLKLGWNEDSEIVHHFDHLVRRRFL